MMFSATLAMAVADFFQQRERSREEVERDAVATIDRLLAEFGNRIAAAAGRTIAAIYIRYSTNLQDSFESQLRAILNDAASKGFSVCKENIFYDLATTGAKYDRDGLTAIRDARQAGKFEVFIAHATSRLTRKLKTLLEVLDEEFVGNGTRCILVDQTLDSKDIERWRLLLPLLGWLDEIQRTNQAGYVRAAHRMLLARRIAYSTTTYGYGGEAIPNFFTKRGRPVQMIVVDEAMAAVVNWIFDKFNSGVAIGRIVKQINANSSLPRPPKSTKNRFSRDFVKRVLERQSYLGISIYNDEVDVSMMSPSEMRELAVADGNIFSFPDLQIVSDEKFLEARQRLQENSDRLRTSLRSPRSRDGNNADRPMLLNGFLFCPQCNNQLVAIGANGTCYGCKTCKFHPMDQQFLYSQMPRRLCTDLIVEAVCEKVLADKAVMSSCVAQFLVETERMQKPDPGHLAVLKKNRREVKERLRVLMGAFKGDHAEMVKDELNEFRSQLTKLDSDISKEQKFIDQTISLPSEKEAYEVLAGFSEILKHISENPTDNDLDMARELISLLTGGRIEAFQCGEKKAQRGWLQVRFQVNLAAALMDRVGIDNLDDRNSVDVVVDIREDAPENPKIAMARKLYDDDLFESEIAKKLGSGRASVCNWIQQSFNDEGKCRSFVKRSRTSSCNLSRRLESNSKVKCGE